MYYIYVLRSLVDEHYYVGYTTDLKRRVEKHNKGIVPATKKRQPLKLIYYEACLNKNDAIKREKYLKTAWGKRYIKSRLKNYLMG